MSHPTLTIGFFPRERFAAAGEALRALVAHTARPFSLIIVDCNTPARYRAEMEEAVAGVPDVRWIRMPEFIQPNASKNLIAVQAQTDLVCMVENDCVVQPGWMDALVDGMTRVGAGAAFPLLWEGKTGGKVHHDRGFADILVRVENGKTIYTITETNDAVVNGWAAQSEPRLVRTTENHCLLYTRETLRALLPFNEAYVVNTGLDISFRLLELGIPLAFVPAARVNHYPPTVIRRDEAAFYRWRWRMAPIREGERLLRASRTVENLPDAADFGFGQHFRTNPVLWFLYRASRIPRWALLKVRKDRFLRDSSLYFVASFIAAALSYLFHPLLGRLLSIEDYGEVQAIISLYGTLAVFLGVFTQLNVNIVANVDEHDHSDVARKASLIAALRGLVYVIGGGLVATLLLASPWIAEFFHFHGPQAVMAMSLFFLTNIFMLFRRSALRGLRDFKATGKAQVLEAAARIGFAAVLVYAGFRVLGAVFGIALGQAAVFGYVYWKTRKSPLFSEKPRWDLSPQVRAELRYAVLIFAASFVTTALFSADVLVVKRYFTPAEAGEYGGLSTIARIVLYATGAVSAVLVPSIKLRNSRAENERLLGKAMAVTALIGGAALLVFTVAPRFAIVTLMGEKYAAQAALLPHLGVVMFLLSLVNPIFSYHLALREKFVAFYGAAALALVLTLCWFDHSSFAVIISHFTWGSAALLVAFAVRHFWRRRIGAAVAPATPAHVA